MAIDFDSAMAAGARDLPFAYADTQTMLYALAIGMGRDPLDARELDFVYEKGLRAVPTLATVIAWGARDVRTLGVDYARILHGEQRLTLHRPLPVAASLRVDTRTVSIHDKGAGKGALIVSRIDIADAATGEALCTLEPTHFARGDGGFSAADGRDSGPVAPPHALPDRAPDTIRTLTTTPEQPLFYRLLGDRNPLHADPNVARAAGFERPILHGLCTYGLCCHAVLKAIIDYRAELIRQFDVRFSAPVFPGETLRVELWRDGDTVSFRAIATGREAVVVNNGRCLLG
jgi:acyl dehydratase